jgi:UDP-N-acetylglucosamine 2-epimerase
MPRITVVITARASLARIYTVLEHLHGRCDLRIVLAGGAVLHHYGDTERDIPFPIAHRVFSSLAGNLLHTTAAETGILAMYLSAIFAEDRPDLVVTIADRHETLATSLAASYQHIPLAHIQGGEHTGSIDDKVRHANSLLADYHFPATTEAANTLRQMGVRGGIYMLGWKSHERKTRHGHGSARDSQAGDRRQHCNSIQVLL